MNREEAALTALLEDFRVRSGELVTLTVEVNRWRSLYLAALVGSVAWLVSSRDSIDQVFANKAVLLFGLSLLNALFSASQAWNSWAIHQNGRFCYEFLVERIATITRSPFGVWDEWRRAGGAHPNGQVITTNGLDHIRRRFGQIEKVVALLVSGVLLFAGAKRGGLSGTAWYAAVPIVVGLNGFVFWYVFQVPDRIEILWRNTIARRSRNESRTFRYGPEA